MSTDTPAATNRHRSSFRNVAIAALTTLGLLGLVSGASAGDGRFGAGQALPAAASATVAAGDFNRDGRPDLAVVSTTNDRLEIHLRGAGGFVAAPSVTTMNDPRQVVVGDFTSDGNDDLALIGLGGTKVNVFAGNGSGGFAKLPDVELGNNPVSLVVGDFNGDNREDLAAGVYGTMVEAVAVRLGDGKGGFVSAPNVAGVAGPLAVGDFNSDSIEDLVGGSSAKAGHIMLGKGGGAFAAPTSFELSQPAPFVRSWAVGDFNSDGHLDVVATLPASAVAVRLGGGDGTFPTGKDIPVSGQPVGVAVADFNSDGHSDFAVGDRLNARLSVRLSDGAGGFTAAPDVPSEGEPVDLAAADFDGDGNDDLAVANYAAQSARVHLGLGIPPLAGNLLVNGGFEGPAPAPTSEAAPAIPGWERNGGATFIAYGFAAHAFSPSRLSSPRYGTGGNSLLWGGKSAATNGITEATQTVDVSGSAEAVDAGRATANLSAYLGGALNVPDTMTARAEFLSAAGAPLGTFAVGPVTAAERRNLTTLLRRQRSAAVPPGTRGIRVSLRSDDSDKSYSSAVADNVKLTLTTTPAPPAPGTPAPAPGTPAPAPGTPPAPGAQSREFGSRTLVSVALAKRRIRVRERLTVRVRNGNAFAVTGRLSSAARIITASGTRVVSLRPKPVSVTAGAARALRIALPARLRHELARRGVLALRLTAVVRDPAGHARRITQRVRVRLIGA